MLLDTQEKTTVLARRWDSSRSALFPIVPGSTLENIVLDAIQGMRRDGLYTRAQARLLARYARCRVDGIEIKRSQWAEVTPRDGARIEVLQGVKGGGGGGGGKNPIATVLSIVVIAAAAVATWYVGGMGAFAAGGALAGWGGVAGGLAGAMVMMGGMMAVNALFPTASPSLGLASTGDLTKDSPTYSISGARNAANPLGYVPLVLGKHRHTPPLGAKSWTMWEGPDQYFNMLVVWGHAGMNVSDFRIGKTPLSNFKNVQHVFHAATYGNDLQLFGKSYNEQSVGASLKASDGWVTRNIGVCEDISTDIAANAMCELARESGAPRTRTVWFQLQYATAGEDDWTSYGGNKANIRAYSRGDGNWTGIWAQVRANMNGDIATGAVVLNPVDTNAYPIELYPNKDPHVTGCDVTFPGGGLNVTAGVYENNDSVPFSAATRSSVVRNYRAEGLPKADRKVRMRRLTGDSGSQYILDECTWSTARAILNQPAFNSPVPLCVSELRIKANEQLSGYVDDFNGLCESVMPAWNGTAWVDAPTRNPAAHMRYLLTSRHGLNEPYTLSKLDESTLIELYEYADANDYEFNFIADTEQNVWSRLVQVLAPARAAPTTDVDGLWGVVIDNEDKEPVQMFTPRNSWGWKVNKTMPRLPHALRVKFVDETQDYAQVEQFVYMDGYSVDGANGTQKATNVIEWDYTGVTRWENLYTLAREHLARLMHRAHSVTLNTDWEWMATSRGKLVRAYSDILMNEFGSARIERLVYDVDGIETLIGRVEDIPTDEYGQPLLPIGIQLDDTVIFSEPAPARYGIAIRNEGCKPTTYELVPEYGDEEHDTLYFKYTLFPSNVPPLGALCSVSLLGSSEEADYLVVSMDHGENNSAEITLIPWAIEPIKAAASGPIPPYNPSIILDVTKGASLPTPIIRDVRSDESVLIRASSGGTTPRIAAWWALSVSTEAATNLNFQLMATDVLTAVNFFGSATSLEDFVAAAGVEEGRLYDVRVRALDPSTGKTSAWSTPIRHAVIGRTTPPPAPDAVNLDGYTLRITQSNRPLDVVGHVVTMVFDETDSITMGRVLTDPYTTTGTFDLTPWAGRARRVFVQTIDELGLLSRSVSVVIDLGDIIPDNVLFEYSERNKAWSGSIVGGYVSSEHLLADSNTLAWAEEETDTSWNADSAYPAWVNGDGVQLSYTWQQTFPREYAGGRVLIEPVALAGKLLAIDHRIYNEQPAWSNTTTDRAWNSEPTDPAWLDPVPTPWNALPDNFTTQGRETLDFRVTYASGEVADLADIITSIDVPDKEMPPIEDINISADGSTRIPIPANYFRAITNVQITLQYREGQDATTAMYVPGSEEIGDNGYLELGPYIVALDSNRQGTFGNGDVRVKGY